MKNCFLILIFPAQGQPNGPLCIGAGLCISGRVWLVLELGSVMSDEALYRTLDYTSFGLASGVSVSYLQKCQLYEA